MQRWQPVLPRSCPPTSVEAFWSQRSRPPREGFLCWSRGFSHSVVHESAWPFHEKGLTVQPSLELTAREREVLTLLAEGASNKVISRRLAISVHTVKYHVASILEKLDATGRTDAVAHAARLGLILL